LTGPIEQAIYELLKEIPKAGSEMEFKLLALDRLKSILDKK
jgi:hypothetical protein